MKRRQIQATGKIDENGRLTMFMGELNQFFAQWKGVRVVARFEVSTPGTSEALKGYYYNYVVPTMRQAMWDNGERRTEEKTEYYLREISPVMHEENIINNKYQSRVRDIDEISNAELIEHIETIKQIAAEEYSVYIEDPKTI